MRSQRQGGPGQTKDFRIRSRLALRQSINQSIKVMQKQRFLRSKMVGKVSDKVTFEQKSVLSKGSGHEDIWGRAFWERERDQPVQRPWSGNTAGVFKELHEDEGGWDTMGEG